MITITTQERQFIGVGKPGRTTSQSQALRWPGYERFFLQCGHFCDTPSHLSQCCRCRVANYERSMCKICDQELREKTHDANVLT